MDIDYDKWTALWNELGLHRFNEEDTQKQLYVIDPPPPFTSGELHMGQVYWLVLVDAIARYKRMTGFNVLYPLGWDTQGFPTESKVEKKYGKNIGRDEFYKRCIEIATQNIKIMKTQMLTLGASYDQHYEYITFTDEYRKKVQRSILEMYEKGFVYRGSHPVEWCKSCRSSIAREETVEVERESSLNHIIFKMEDKKLKELEIATTRPELLHACVAIAVNPQDKRYTKYIGKNVILPLFDRTVSVIADESVDIEFGTGAEMICTFGDKNDVIFYYKHKLGFIEAIDKRGMLINSNKYDGIDTTQARIMIIEDLKAAKLFKKEEPVKQSIKVHDRCSTPIELLITTQWFMRTKEHAKRIREIADSINWTPSTTKQILYDWINFIEWDWNISRSRVFGTPIPFWYCSKCGEVIPADKKDLPVNPAVLDAPVKKCKKCGSNEIVGEIDTCDCWIDSSITPMVVAGWLDNNKLFKRAYPVTIRVLGTEIIRTWAFYTIYRNMALQEDKPFENIIAHGLILGTDGKEMHKSLGNGISPDELLKKYSVDNIRLWVALSGSIAKNKVFSYEELNYGKNFINKLYNSSLFVKTSIADIKNIDDIPAKDMGVFDLWILARMNQVIKEVVECYDNYDIYSASTKIINFYWHEFCDYYLENVKYRIHSEDKKMEGSKIAAGFTLKSVIMTALELLAPIMPFAVEQIHSMFEQKSIFLNKFPQHVVQKSKNSYVMNGLIFNSIIPDVEEPEAIGALLNDIISIVRKAKAAQRLALNKEIAAININVADTYYNAIDASKHELMGICKAKKVNIRKGKDFSVKVEI